MKKFLFAVALVMMFVGCSKDDENTYDNHEIEASAWAKDDPVFKDEGIGLGINGIGHYKYTTNSKDPKFYMVEFKYIYKKPKIELKFNDGSNFDNGYIEGDKMYLEKRGTFTRYR